MKREVGVDGVVLKHAGKSVRFSSATSKEATSQQKNDDGAVCGVARTNYTIAGSVGV